jgi:hypothetical protein
MAFSVKPLREIGAQNVIALILFRSTITKFCLYSAKSRKKCTANGIGM